MSFFDTFLYYYFKIFKPSFLFQNKTYNYFCHKYNFTWRNERAIEIPIIWTMVKKHNAKEVLEVGNVLSHYFNVKHDVIDKYEKTKGIINKDIVNFKPSKKYSLIVSISTLEHIGFEKEINPKKALKALENLKSNCLASKGKLIVTFPLGFNSFLDNLLVSRKLDFAKEFYLKRVLPTNRWKETNLQEIKDSKYNYKHSHANALIIGIIEKGLPSFYCF
ncbi:hypothetical protein KKG83_05105 [Candidatus Micrarchaeota archaeon]|nr:hypothetical protein [Candidatus Micrarchaeota archaeon]